MVCCGIVWHDVVVYCTTRWYNTLCFVMTWLVALYCIIISCRSPMHLELRGMEITGSLPEKSPQNQASWHGLMGCFLWMLHYVIS